MRIVVIGLGSMGKRRIRLMKSLDKSIEIYGVDSNHDRQIEASKKLDICCYNSLEELCESKELDAAFVCTSPNSHATLIKSCLEYGLHVFTELNLIATLYEENMELAKQKSLCLFLSSTQLYRKEMQLINEAVNHQKTNYIYHVGQYLPDWHPWESYKNYFVSNKETNGCRELLAIELPWILNTFGMVKTLSVISNKLTTLELNYPDFYTIQLVHENGSIGTVIIDIVSREPVRRLEIMNESLYIQWRGKPDSLIQKNLQTGIMESICNEKNIKQEGYQEFINEYAYLKEINEFFQVMNGMNSRYGFQEDLETLRLIDKIEQMAGKLV